MTKINKWMSATEGKELLRIVKDICELIYIANIFGNLLTTYYFNSIRPLL
jgi:hypothetical protein